MIYELRTYTLAPGTLQPYLRLSRDVGRKIRGDRYGKLEGAWSPEFGTVNQYIHLWSYADLADRQRAREGLAKDKAWNTEYTPQIRPMLVAQENKILAPVSSVPFSPPGPGRHVYEIRTYRTHVGKLAEWIGHFTEALKIREKYSKIVGLWSTEISQLNEVVHIWAYNDLNQRADVRGRVAQDPEWQAFLAKGTPLLADTRSNILVPTETSPLQ